MSNQFRSLGRDFDFFDKVFLPLLISGWILYFFRDGLDRGYISLEFVFFILFGVLIFLPIALLLLWFAGKLY